MQLVCCPQCGKVVGRTIAIGDLELLQIGNLIVRSVHGTCGSCGKPFHWSISSQALSRLIEMVLQIRSESVDFRAHGLPKSVLPAGALG